MAREPFRNIGLIAKSESEQALYSLRQLVHFLHGRDAHVILDRELGEALPELKLQAASRAQLGESCDLVIVVGGDGCLLGAARALARYDVPVLGINRGRLGFLTDILPSEIESRVGQVLDGDYHIESRFLLDLEVRRGKTVVGEGSALNDVVLLSGDSVHMIEFELYIDGHYVYNQRSDGLIISTPTGSTAYALSAGGPVLHPRLGGFVLVPIAPHALSNRPIAIPDSSEILIQVMGGRDVSVNFDMQTLTSLAHHDRIIIRRSAHAITFLHPLGWYYYVMLREKLHWNEYPSADGQLK